MCRLEAENESLKKEIAELRISCVGRSEFEELKQDIERLKKSSPSASASGSPGLYSRVKPMKKGRPQSLHEVNITQAMQEQLAKPVTEYFIGSLPPFYFTLDNFAHHKKHALKWYSPTFYSHPNGYKMCVCVSSDGPHISVLVHLVRGEFDDSLQWPFSGSINVYLLNQRHDGGHHSAEVVYDSDTTLVQSGRVEGTFERSAGHGNPLFIEYEQLAYEQSTDCEYLSQDRLRFMIECVKVQ